MGIIDLIKKLKNRLLKVRERKHKLALLEKHLRNIRHLAVENRENREYFTPSEKEEVEAEFERLKSEAKKLVVELEEEDVGKLTGEVNVIDLEL